MINKDECIIWTGPTITTHGNTYGRLKGKKLILAHRFEYEKVYGKIHSDLVIDHLCRNGLCVNPKHLEAVSNKENILRGEGICAINARKTHCKRGHLLSAENTYCRKNGKRDCKLCNAERRKHT
jgi:hypothetical protein